MVKAMGERMVILGVLKEVATVTPFRSTYNLQLSVVRDQCDETQRYSAFSVLPYEY